MCIRDSHNTDGIGFIRDVTQNLRTPLQGARILLLGAGGAAFGILQSLLEQNPSFVIISNRTFSKANEAAKVLSNLIDTSNRNTVCMAVPLEDLGDTEFDVIINSTSTGLSDTPLPIPNAVFAKNSLAYEMMYGRETLFMAQARANGAHVADGLGMLVEQAAEAFYIWRGMLPETAPVIAILRNRN